MINLNQSIRHNQLLSISSVVLSAVVLVLYWALQWVIPFVLPFLTNRSWKMAAEEDDKGDELFLLFYVAHCLAVVCRCSGVCPGSGCM